MRTTLAELQKDKRGYPIPWFVTMMKPNGEPDFVAIHPTQAFKAVMDGRCWICGGLMGIGSRRTFVCGPLSVATRHATEPPMHLDCARFAVRTCPFMLNPNYRRSMTIGGDMPGLAIDRNPAVSILCSTARFKVKIEPNGPLFTLPHADAMRLEAWREGRAATRAEYLESLEEGREIIRSKTEIPAEAMEEFDRIFTEARDTKFENMP